MHILALSQFDVKKMHIITVLCLRMTFPSLSRLLFALRNYNSDSTCGLLITNMYYRVNSLAIKCSYL